MIRLDIDAWNKKLKDRTPHEIAEWALRLSDNKIVTTSFGVYSSVLLSTMSQLDKDIRVVWCDTLYNQPSTYEHASNLIETYNLNINKYQPLISKETIDKTIGLPSVENDNHDKFSEVVKLEPFRRALKEQDPEVWFTNIRVRQTEYRDKKDILSYSKDGILKVSPFYYWSDKDLDAYLEANQLPKNSDYFDPVKALLSRECGIHFQ
ncbi:phosphoadenosine phosphosulfate reductase family protein [Winogradskyella sp. SYSU M77433]|uniref:phosphoadenosine phosphosulfate reductase domain-containing protein n=1 Tax=Winogradskyella sp. SYSU M77433 TaxID=3042722 RepID=UPI0024801889|nr:phosphoadenosine phosphosulfate reductase family protein [Winogradskyella sp. SYSU M77433]MDH7911854.1 phosphoadenosine phosphosulfate reductase family protein [Winogradskyella sp. SYSU M77433]